MEPFWAAAEPSASESSSRSSWAEPRREQARLLLPIAGRHHLRDHRRRRQQQRQTQLKELELQERPLGGGAEEAVAMIRRRGREGEQCASGGRVGVGFLRPRERERETKEIGGEARRCCSAELCLCVIQIQEKVASGSGEEGGRWSENCV